MFKEFSRCSRKGFILSVLTGVVIILAFAGLTAITGKVGYGKAGLVLGLGGARLAEALFSRRCPLTRAGLEGAVLALVGVVLVAADDYVTGLLA